MSGFVGYAMVWLGGVLVGTVYSTLALAAGSRRAKTPQAVECEASQSGGTEECRNAQSTSPKDTPPPSESHQ